MERTAVEIPKKVKIIIALAIGIPAAVAVIFTLMQRWPATYAINYMADANGNFPMKATILINCVALLIAELLLLLPVLLIKKAFFNKRQADL